MSQDGNSSRRRVLQSIAGSTAAIVGATGTTSARERSQPENSYSDGIFVRDGRFELGAEPHEVGEFRYEVSRGAVEQFNAAIERGYFEIEQEEEYTIFSDGDTHISTSSNTDTEQLAAALDSYDTQSASIPHDREEYVQESAISTSSCNRSGLSSSSQWLPPEVFVTLYLSNDDIRDINAIAGASGPTGAAIYDRLVARGVVQAGALSGPVATAFFAGVAAYWGWVQFANDGCGVKIESGISTVNPLVPTPTVKGQ